MVRTGIQTKTPRTASDSAFHGELNTVAETEHDLVVEIPLVVRIRPIGVEPTLTVVVALDVEDVRVAVGIGCVPGSIHTTALRPLSGLNLIRDRNRRELGTKYVYFLS